MTEQHPSEAGRTADRTAGHNGGPDWAGHLHSHLHGDAPQDAAEALQVLAQAFIDGFCRAADKTSFLHLAGIPFELSQADGPSLKLVDVELKSGYQVGTASPGFASQDLVYLAFPGEMVRERTNMSFVYVSLRERREVDLRQFLADRHG